MGFLESFWKQRNSNRFFFAWRITFCPNIRWRYCCKDYEKVKQKTLSFKTRPIISILRTQTPPGSRNTAFPSCMISRTLSSNGERQSFPTYLHKEVGYETHLLMICIIISAKVTVLHLSIISRNSSKFMCPSPSMSPSRIISYN